MYGRAGGISERFDLLDRFHIHRTAAEKIISVHMRFAIATVIKKFFILTPEGFYFIESSFVKIPQCFS
jgi:hypothetical protein